VVTVIDVLRRGGLEVVVAGLSVHDGHAAPVKCARGTRIIPDVALSASEVTHGHWDAIVLAGGMPGAQHFHDNEILTALLTKQHSQHHLIAAVCASPAIVLAPLGILSSVEATCFPAMQDKLPHAVKDRVKVAGHIITSQGPGTSMEYALEILAHLAGREAAVKVANGLLVPFH
jgi:4-methyl-5(b-hydroxyethyl)-thiazole monophosphate biosynthesis